MSASTEKKNRQAARDAGTDKKTLAQQKEAAERAKSNRRWTIGTIAVLLCVAVVLVLSSPLMYKLPAYTVGNRSFSAAEANYYYGSQYSTYASYASMIGLDTSAGLAGLDKQQSSLGEGTWKDYFLNNAKTQMRQTAALVDYAGQQGLTLSEDEIANVDQNFEGLGDIARTNGFGSADKLMAANYGAGVNVAIVRQAYLDSALASKAQEHAQESFQYSDEELEKHYQDFAGSHDYFFYSEVEIEDVADAADPHAAAMEKAEALVEAYNSSDKTGSAAYDIAIVAAAQEMSAEVQSNITGDQLGELHDWMVDAGRQVGDIGIIDGEGHVHVVVYLMREDNHYKTQNARHILVRVEASEDGTYSDEAKAAAKAKADEILAEYEAGAKTEESFAELANKYSEDPGSNTTGGLYENIYQGQMVVEFNDFCYAEGRQHGDTGIVYSENSNYAGYHIIYYVGEGELYSNMIARDDLSQTAMSDWLDQLTEGYPTSEGFGMKWVG